MLIIGLSGFIFVVLQLASGERKAAASGGESLLDHLRPGRVRPTFEVPKGTRLHVRLKERITEKNRAGDIFVGKLDRDVAQGGKLLAPQGSRVIGRITRLAEDTRRSSSTQVSLVLEQVVLGEKAFPLQSMALTLSTPAGIASARNRLFLQGPQFSPYSQGSIEDEAGRADSGTTIYEPDTRLTFVLAERLRLPAFVPAD